MSNLLFCSFSALLCWWWI